MATQEPLPTTTSTRLLTVYPGLYSDPITASLFTIDLATAHPAYGAISYTWADGYHTADITVDGTSVSLRPNLHQGLVHLRSPS